MKRIIPILLLVGLCLPVLFESCKPKLEDNPTPGTKYQPDSVGVYSLLFRLDGQLPNTKAILIMDYREDLKDSKALTIAIAARLVEFDISDYSSTDPVILKCTKTIAQNGSELKGYSTFSSYYISELQKVKGYRKVTDLTENQIRKVLNDKDILAFNQPQKRLSNEIQQAGIVPLIDNLLALINPSGNSVLLENNVYKVEDVVTYIMKISGYAGAIGAGALGVIGYNITLRTAAIYTIAELGKDASLSALMALGGPLVTGAAIVVGSSLLFGVSYEVTAEFLAKIAENLNAKEYAETLRTPIWQLLPEFGRTLFDGETWELIGKTIKGWFASSSGDPHLVTLDKVKYDFQAMGEFVAMKSTTDKFEVQVRYGAQGESSVTFNKAIAINTGADVISYEPAQTYVYVNKQKVNSSQINEKSYTLPGGGSLTRSSGILLITTPNNDQIAAITNGFYFKPADNRKGKLVGLFGNFDENMSNDGRTRDNKVVNLLRPDHLYPTYADSWRITQAESLFFYENGATTETYTDRTKPNNKRPFNSLSLAERQQAEAICRQAGVTREPELSNCILDVAITGDAAYATLASVAAKANPTDNNFLPLADYPGKSAEGDVGVTAGDKIYAGLGKTSVDWAMYDPAVDKWTTKTPFPGGKTAYVRMGTFAINNKIYCVGGAIDNTATNALWEYDTQTDAWTRRKDLPGVARYNIASFATGGKGYALFGATGWGLGESDYPTKSALYEYDPTTDNWTQKADFPDKPRGNNITSAEFNGMVIVINGRPFVGGGTGSGRVWDDWYEYIPARNSWEKRAKAYGGTYYCAIGNVAYTLFNRYQMSYDATTDTWSKYPGKEIYLPLSTNMIRGLYQLPVLNGKAYLGLGIGTDNVSNKEWWSFTP